MQTIKALARPETLGIPEVNPIPELTLDQSTHDSKSWESHDRFASAVKTALHLGTIPFDERQHRTFEEGSDEQKLNRASDYASALKQLISSIDLPKLHGTFSNILYRHREQLEPKLKGALQGVFLNAREMVDTLTDELKTLPIPKFNVSSESSAQPTEQFWNHIKELGLNTEF